MKDLILPQAWDSLDEKTVQAAIHSQYPSLRREVKLEGNFVDFLSPNHACIELKKSSSSKGKRYLTRPTHAIGQVLGYRASYAHSQGLELGNVRAVILLYGSMIGAWRDDYVTRTRLSVGVELWQLVSLKNSEIIDLDSGENVRLELV